MSERASMLPPVFFLGALALEAVLHFGLPVTPVVRTPSTWLGAIPILLGLAVMLVGDRQFKRARTAISPYEQPSILVWDGVFRVSRNPMYLGMVAMLLGEALAFGTLTPLTVPWVFAWVMWVRFIRTEEAILSEVFGADYEEYRRLVRRWV